MKNKDKKIINQELNKFIIKNKYFHLMLGFCKYCKHFTDRGIRIKDYTRYQCDKKDTTVYEAYSCQKTNYLRGRLEMSL